MCGTLKFQRGDTSVAKIGNPVPCTNEVTGKTGKAIWSGFAQEEKSNWWKEQSNGADVKINIQSFTEDNYEFKAPGPISGIGLRKDVEINGDKIGAAKTVKILTRPPANEFEKSIHHRWPVCKIDNESYVFTNNDVLRGQLKLKEK